MFPGGLSPFLWHGRSWAEPVGLPGEGVVGGLHDDEAQAALLDHEMHLAVSAQLAQGGVDQVDLARVEEAVTVAVTAMVDLVGWLEGFHYNFQF
jgi:hypothetical protein